MRGQILLERVRVFQFLTASPLTIPDDLSEMYLDNVTGELKRYYSSTYIRQVSREQGKRPSQDYIVFAGGKRVYYPREVLFDVGVFEYQGRVMALFDLLPQKRDKKANPPPKYIGRLIPTTTEVIDTYGILGVVDLSPTIRMVVSKATGTDCGFALRWANGVVSYTCVREIGDVVGSFVSEREFIRKKAEVCLSLKGVITPRHVTLEEALRGVPPMVVFDYAPLNAEGVQYTIAIEGGE